MSNRSAFEAIPGKEALVEYVPKVYPEKSYVEKDGLVYKSLTGTSNTFISSQWELIADLREVRVPNIASRNALTGNTPTSGTTGIRIPILDNTNVLVLNAIADPQVGLNEFARYNYNQGTSSWLLLQAGTGATNTNVSDYTLLTNKPSVVSGITVNVGAGLTGGGSVLGTASAPYAAGGTITVSHSDTSSISDINNSGYAYVQKLNFDGFGHVTGGTSSTWVHPDTSSQANVVNSGYAYIQSISVDGDGHLTSMTSSTWVHPDTSSQANSVNSGSVFIQSISLDGAGHVIGLGTGTVPAGGVGFNFKLNGDSGGVVTIPSGGTVTISGGTNISTLRTGSGMNTGVRLNFLPAGATNQIQLNNGGTLGANANLTFTGGTTLVSNKLSLTTQPVSGSTTNEFLVRNPISGAIQRLSIGTILSPLTANNGINRIGNNFRLGGALTGNTTISGAFGFNFTNDYVTIGSRSGATGINSFTVGINNQASNAYGVSFGEVTKSTGISGLAAGSHTLASGDYSTALGWGAIASGMGSHASGFGNGSGKGVIASGQFAFNHSFNHNVSQTAGHGALAQASAILGGQDHNIDSSNTNAAIIGGTTIKLGVGYSNFVAVPSLALWTAPVAGAAGTDDVLVWNATDKKVKKVTQASLAGAIVAAGSNTEVQFNNGGVLGASSTLTFNTGTNLLTTTNMVVGNQQTLTTVPTLGTLSDNILSRNTSSGVVERVSTASILAPLTANNGLTRNGNNFRLGGVLTGDTTIGSGNQYDIIFGNRSLTLGSRNAGGVGNYSFAIGTGNVIPINQGVVIGLNNDLTGGLRTNVVIGDNNVVSGGAYNNLIVGSNHNVTSTGGNPGSNLVSGAQNYTTGYTNVIGGQLNSLYKNYSFAHGYGNNLFGDNSAAIGSRFNRTRGLASVVGGNTYGASRRNVAAGISSFSFQAINDSLGVFPNGEGGTYANHSAILGGLNNNIDVSNTGATIIGGNTVTIPAGAAYTYHGVVSNLAIWTAPVAGAAGTDDVLVWNATDKKVKKVTQASLSGGGGGTPAGANTQIQFNNAGAFGASANLTYSSGLNLLSTGNLTLSVVPTVGSLSDNILVRNISTGAVEKIPTSSIGLANNGITKLTNTYVLGGTITGNTIIGLNNFGFTWGNRLGGTVGTNSYAIGVNLIASGQTSFVEGFSNTAGGNYSHAEGNATKAIGQASHAEGYNTRASGTYSHAEGQSTIASGNFSHAEGGNSVASGSQSHAENNSTASGDFSHAEGNASFATGSTSHAEGNSMAGGQYSHAEGNTTRAMGNGSHTEGLQTRANGTYAHAQNAYAFANGNYSHAGGYSSGGASKEVLALGQSSFNHSENSSGQINGSGALTQASAILGGQDHNVNGIHSIVLGGSTNRINSGVRSAILGGSLNTITAISADGSVVIGGQSNLMNDSGGSLIAAAYSAQLNTTSNSVILGSNGTIINSAINVIALGVNSTTLTNAFNNHTVVANLAINTAPSAGATVTDDVLVWNSTDKKVKKLAQSSLIPILTANNGINKIGNNFRLGGALTGDTTIGGSFAFNFNNGSWTFGTRGIGTVGTSSFVNGVSNIASGVTTSYAEGGSTTAGGGYSHAEGYSTKAMGNYSHAQGYFTRASAVASHAEGQSTIASGTYSHAEGFQTTASAQSSHAEGDNTIASGTTSHAEGYQTRAGGSYSHAEGYSTKAMGSFSHVGGFGNSVSLLSNGQSAFNHSENSNVQIVGHGALANNSAILGGLNHNIESTNFRAAIIGGNAIKLTGSTYIDTTAVANLAIFTQPALSSVASDDILMYNQTLKFVRRASSSVYTRTAYVSKGGNDSTAVIGSMIKPFLTINGAITALVAGSPAPSLANKCLVDVSGGGYYNETINLATFVDINLNGATVNTISESSANVVTCKVFGKGNTQYEGLSGGGGIFITNTNNASRFEFDMNEIWCRNFTNASVFRNSFVTANLFESTFSAVPILFGGLFNYANISEMRGSIRPVTTGETHFTTQRHICGDSSSEASSGGGGAIILMNYTTGQPVRYTKLYYKSNSTTTIGTGSPILFNKFAGNFSGETYFSGNFYANGSNNGVICTNGAGNANEIRGSAYYDGIFKNFGGGGVMRLGVNPAGVPFKTIIKGGTSLVSAGQSIYNNDVTAINVLVYGQVVATSVVGSLITPIIGSIIVNASVV